MNKVLETTNDPRAGFFRHLLFWCAWALPSVGLWFGNMFFFFHLLGLQTFDLEILNHPSQFLMMGFIAWGSLWLAFGLSQSLWPALLLMFTHHDKERSPKRIIQMGERFRKVDLSSPQTVILSEVWGIWQNRIWGFFVFPSPFGAMLPVSSRISAELSADEYNAWISRQIVEARFFRFSSPGILWFQLSLCGAVFGQLLLTTEIPLGLGAGLGVILATMTWRFLRIRRIFAMDAKAAHDFQLEKDFLLATLQKAEALAPTPFWNFAFLRPSWQKRAEALNSPRELRSWLTIAVPSSVWIAAIAASWILTPATVLHPVSIKEVPAKAQAFVKTAAETTDTVKLNPQGLPISAAVLNGNLRGVIQALSMGNTIQSHDPAFGGATPLLLALRQGDLELVYMLLSMGASLANEQDSAGRGALFYATLSTNRAQVVSYVLSAKVALDQPDRSGKTVLQLANENGWTDVAQILQSTSASRQISSTSPATPNTNQTPKESHP